MDLPHQNVAAGNGPERNRGAATTADANLLLTLSGLRGGAIGATATPGSVHLLATKNEARPQQQQQQLQRHLRGATALQVYQRNKLTTKQKLDEASKLHKVQLQSQRKADPQQAQAPSSQLSHDILARMLQQQQGQPLQPLQATPTIGPAPLAAAPAPDPSKSNQEAAALLRQAFSVEQLQTIMDGLKNGKDVQEAAANALIKSAATSTSTQQSPSVSCLHNILDQHHHKVHQQAQKGPQLPQVAQILATSTAVAPSASATANAGAVLNGESAMAQLRASLQEAQKIHGQQQLVDPAPPQQGITHQDERQTELRRLYQAEEILQQLEASILKDLAQNQANGTAQNARIPLQLLERTKVLLQHQLPPQRKQDQKPTAAALLPPESPAPAATNPSPSHLLQLLANRLRPATAQPPLPPQNQVPQALPNHAATLATPKPVTAPPPTPHTASVDLGNLLKAASSNGAISGTSDLMRLLQAHSQQQTTTTSSSPPHSEPAISRESLEAVLMAMQQQQQQHKTSAPVSPSPPPAVSPIPPNPAATQAVPLVTAPAPVFLPPIPSQKRCGRTGTFPQKLHQMLEDAEAEGLTDIVSFLENSSSFAVHQPAVFARLVMHKYFKMGSYASFQRQLNLYNFIRIESGKDRGAYRHALFVRGKPLLSTMMRRTKTKGRPQARRQQRKILSSSSPMPPKEAESSDEELL